MIYETKQCATLEDMHGEITEEEYFEQLAQRDALDCSLDCYRNVYGYHTGNCSQKTASDIAMARRDEAVTSMALGK